jgi:hypothetical protein
VSDETNEVELTDAPELTPQEKKLIEISKREAEVKRREHNKINEYLQMHGCSPLEDPGLINQLAFVVRDHEHFGQVLRACEPENRTAMYDAMKPYLSFDAKPLDYYLMFPGTVIM